MKIWKYEKDHFSEEPFLWKALELPIPQRFLDHRQAGRIKQPGPAFTVSLVGAGGKTSTMYRLAEELSALGLRVLVTTSTHIYHPHDRSVFVREHAGLLDETIWNRENIAVVGRTASVPGKLKGFSEEEMSSLVNMTDVLLIEADGAKCLPLKLPKENEPVLIPETAVVIGCMGLDSIGKTWEEGCFRYNLAPEVLGRRISYTDVIDENDASHILLSERGTKKSVKAGAYRILLNKADDEEKCSRGERIAELVHEVLAVPCVMSCYAG